MYLIWHLGSTLLRARPGLSVGMISSTKLLSNWTILVTFKFWEIPEINFEFDKYGHASIKLHKSYVTVLTYDRAWFGVLCDFSTCPTYNVIGLWVSISLTLLTSFQSFYGSLLYTQLDFSSYKRWCSFKISSDNSNWNYAVESICLVHLL
jgi:hypothetical protein